MRFDKHGSGVKQFFSSTALIESFPFQINSFFLEYSFILPSCIKFYLLYFLIHSFISPKIEQI